MDDDQQGAAAGTGPEVTATGDTASVANDPVLAAASRADDATVSSGSTQDPAPLESGTPAPGAPLEPGAGPLDLSPEVAGLAEPVSPTAGGDDPSVRASTPDRSGGEPV